MPLVVGDRPNLLLTGRPGCGKTTVIERTLDLLPNVTVGGFYTREIRQAGRRVGVAIIGLGVGEGVLAHVSSNSPCRLSRYGVNVDDMDRIGVAALERALHDCDVILADEIGRMEMYSENFCARIVRCLDAAKPCLATIQSRPGALLNSIRARSDVELIEVTRANRDALPAALATALRARLG